MEATLLTLTFFAPMATLVAASLLTHRTSGPATLAVSRRAALVPLPPARSAPRAGNDARYLQAA